jgi:hypothetical protein
MLRFDRAGLSLTERHTRRDFLRIGGALGLTMSAQRRAAGATTEPPRARSCIVLFLMGGPPQHSTWDPKPLAPPEVRGEFDPINTTVPGMQIGELLPQTARLAQHLCLLRAMHTGDNAHSSSGYYMMTGVPHQPMNAENANPGPPNDWPHFGSIVRHLRHDVGGLPAAARLPHHIWNTDGSVWPGQDAGFLGRRADPWLFRCEPAASEFRIPELSLPESAPLVRLAGRQSLLEQFDRLRNLASQAGSFDQYGGVTRQAFELLMSPASRAAFDLEREPAAVRDRYGRTQFGQSTLLARRLVEAGVSLVQVNWFRSPDEPADAPCWDSHTREAERLKSVLVPPFDQAYSALLHDLLERNLLDETLVVCLSEFGRSPKINAAGGRDHWGNVFSVALAGGGIRGGIVHGASDRLGGEPQSGTVEPPDLLATMLHLLGIAPATEIHDRLGRPLPLCSGQVIRGILA